MVTCAAVWISESQYGKDVEQIWWNWLYPAESILCHLLTGFYSVLV